MSESRTLVLDQETVKILCSAGEHVANVLPHQLRSVLPPALSEQEINDVGMQVANATELLRPSWDGISRGRYAENQSIFSIGSVAAKFGDLVTAENAKNHLRRWPWTVTGLAGSLVLGKELKRHRQTILQDILRED